VFVATTMLPSMDPLGNVFRSFSVFSSVLGFWVYVGVLSLLVIGVHGQE
jgi:hypothetical protein